MTKTSAAQYQTWMSYVHALNMVYDTNASAKYSNSKRDLYWTHLTPWLFFCHKMFVATEIVFQWTQRCRYTCCPLCPPQIHLYQQRIQLFSEMMPLPHVVLWGNVKWHFTEWMSSWTFWPGKNISRWLLSVLFVGRIICIMIASVNLEAIYKKEKEKKEAPSVSFNLH